MRKNPYQREKELEEIKERNMAVALKYDLEQSQAPFVVATGKGLIADAIVEKAKESGVPIQSDATLVELLSQLNINESTPSCSACSTSCGPAWSDRLPKPPV